MLIFSKPGFNSTCTVNLQMFNFRKGRGTRDQSASIPWIIKKGRVPEKQLSSVQSLSRIRLFATPWITTCQASLSITNSRSSLKLMCIESVMPSSHLILCHPLLLLPPISPSIRVFSNESTLRMRWPKYWNFSFTISPSDEHPGLISFRMDWLGPPCSPRDSQEFSTTPQFKLLYWLCQSLWLCGSQ